MKQLFTLLISLCLSLSLTASPARRTPFTAKQSDGTLLSVILTGDESLHYYCTTDGKPLVKESNGDFSYALLSGGIFVSTELLAHNVEDRTADELQHLSSLDYSSMTTEISETSRERTATYRNAMRSSSQRPVTGDINVAVILVEFQDCKFTFTKEDVGNMLNTENFVYENPLANSIGSARDYFIEQSDGKFRPNFILSDIITLDNNMSYYGGNNTSGNDNKPSHMVKEGIEKADALFDFSACDNDGDGEVDFVYCIYAGYSESYGADANTIWPHQFKLSAIGNAGSITVDGVKCDMYACSGELVGNEEYEEVLKEKYLTGIGLICHEFSHCLGLHDVYDVTGSSGNWGMDYWDLMDQGQYSAEGYVPTGYSAYQRDLFGWRELVVLDEPGDYSMKPLTQRGVGYKIVNDNNSDEYYILENRKCEKWDTYLFGEGMLITHVDYLKSAWDNNKINTTAGHPRYTIIPADNELAVFGEVSNEDFIASLKGDMWPGTSGNTELTDASQPAAEVYTGGYMSKPVTNIKYKDYIISFSFNSGSNTTGIDKVITGNEERRTIYDLQGRNVKETTASGIYIIDNKKVRVR